MSTQTGTRVEFIYLSQEEVLEAGGLDMSESLKTIEQVWATYDRGECIQPIKPVIRWGEDHTTEETRGRIMAMPAYIGGPFEVAGLKWIPSAPQNPVKLGLPRANALILLTDPYTGLPLAIMDGTIVSAMRTGAATGVAAKYLARKDSRAIGLIGAGVQARTQLMAIVASFPELEFIRVFDVNAEKTKAFAAEMSEKLGVRVIPVGSPEEAIRGADIVTTPTMATEPYLESAWLKEGSFYSDMSSHDAKDEVYLEADRIFVDDWPAIQHHGTVSLARLHASGRLAESRINGDIHGVVTGRIPGRLKESDRIVFRPLGMAIEDVAEAFRVYKSALERGIGQKLKLYDRPLWV